MGDKNNDYEQVAKVLKASKKLPPVAYIIQNFEALRENGYPEFRKHLEGLYKEMIAADPAKGELYLPEQEIKAIQTLLLADDYRLEAKAKLGSKSEDGPATIQRQLRTIINGMSTCF